MRHKDRYSLGPYFGRLPSKEWLVKKLCSLFGQRLEFTLLLRDGWPSADFMLRIGLDLAQPVRANGILQNVWKKPLRGQKDSELHICYQLRGVVFKQTGKVVPYWQRNNRRMSLDVYASQVVEFGVGSLGNIASWDLVGALLQSGKS